MEDLEPLFPDRTSAEPLARQLARRLRSAIESGLYAPSSRILPRRELARRLGLAQNTVSDALDRLIGEGYLESRVGSGTFVAAGVRQIPPLADVPIGIESAAARRYDEALDILSDGAAVGVGPLRAGIPDLASFPLAAWSRIARRHLAVLPAQLGYGDSAGDPALREAIARHVQQFRGVSARAHRVIVVDGTQAAIALAADVLLEPGDRVLVEDPCYAFARAALHARGFDVHAEPVDDDGLDATHAPQAKLAYVTPSHQFPLGATMSVERRHRLLAWAERHDAYVLEDDYDSEYSFGTKPLPTLQSIDSRGRVLYAGTFSKTLAPGLRLGYLIVPEHLARVFAVARTVSTLGGERFVQSVLADFMTEGHFARYVRRTTIAYAKRRAAAIARLEPELAPYGLRLGPGTAGLHLTFLGKPPFDDLAVARRFEARGWTLQTLSTLCVRRTDVRGFLVGYTAEPLPDVLDGARALVSAVAETNPALNR